MAVDPTPIQITIVVTDFVTPGEGGYVDCATVEECLVLNRTLLAEERIGLGDLIEFSIDDPVVTFETKS